MKNDWIIVEQKDGVTVKKNLKTGELSRSVAVQVEPLGCAGTVKRPGG